MVRRISWVTLVAFEFTEYIFGIDENNPSVVWIDSPISI